MKNKIHVFEKAPEDFKSQAYITAAYVRVGNKILLLQLSDLKQEAKCWGVPAGKLEINEVPEIAVQRELFEETGIVVVDKSIAKSIGQLYMRKSDIDYTYHAFSVHLTEMPNILLSSEHTAFEWVDLDDVPKLPLMAGAIEAFNFYLTSLNS